MRKHNKTEGEKNMYEGLKTLINFFVEPFLDLLTDLGLGAKIIKVGFGEVEWLNFTLLELTELILSGLVIYLFMKLVYKIFKKLVKIISGGTL